MATKTKKNNEVLYINGKYVARAEKPLHPTAHKKGTSPYKKADGKKVKVTLVKSTIACLDDQKATIEALGLVKIRQSKVFEHNDALAGMLFKVKHLVEVEEVKEAKK